MLLALHTAEDLAQEQRFRVDHRGRFCDVGKDHACEGCLVAVYSVGKRTARRVGRRIVDREVFVATVAGGKGDWLVAGPSRVEIGGKWTALSQLLLKLL